MGSVLSYTGFASTSPTLSRIFSDSVTDLLLSVLLSTLSAANNIGVDAPPNKLFSYIYYYTPLMPMGNLAENFMRICIFPFSCT